MDLTENTLWWLKQAFYFSLTEVNESVKEHGVTTAQIGVLRQLANQPGLSGAELARRLLITPQGVQLALTALEKRGLVERKQDLADTLTVAGKFITSLAEALASGPYFKVMLVNLIPPQILQPFVDSAFKKRGIDPEEFWRNAGLPSARFPDPNGKRFENGAPPPAPTPLEGTPEHPGPAVPPGSPCSYTPTAAGIPSPGNPMPCAAATQGPFGGPEYGPPDLATSAPNPDGIAHSPGVPSAAVPGQMPPDQPGAPVELAPGPPGARTVPIAPLPVPPGDIPGYAPHPPPLNAPPAPPGPGPDAGPAGTPPLPGNPPFLPPGSQG